ncbi:MAG: type II toxin-antitoxin system HicB family antitoxin [Lachnospiraceae bacterium]|nr:type II toxin-antitoxin system HicB family antitoxin [Lachnospiraceae bacterium]
MRFIYPAILKQDTDGSYVAHIPDLTGCTARGFDINDCLEEINLAARQWIELELEEEDVSLPPVSDPADFKLADGEFVRQISIQYRMTDGWDE